MSDHTEQETKNIKTIEQIVSDGQNKGNLNVANDLVTPDFVYYLNNVALPDVGSDAIRNVIIQVNNVNEHHETKIEEIFAKGDKVVFRWTFNGKHKPTGKLTNNSGTLIAYFRDGKIYEFRQAVDFLTLFQSQGFKLVPPDPTEE